MKVDPMLRRDDSNNNVGSRALIPHNGRLYETVELWNGKGISLLLVRGTIPGSQDTVYHQSQHWSVTETVHSPPYSYSRKESWSGCVTGCHGGTEVGVMTIRTSPEDHPWVTTLGMRQVKDHV
jgi:hypothetical protein